MKTTTKRVFAIAGLLALGLSAVKAQSDGALLDALVKKGVLSDQEAEDIRANEAKDYATTSAGKLALGDYVNKLTIYGDARLRYEYLDEKPQSGLPAAAASEGAGQGDNVVERYRYRLRIGADYTYSENFKAGFELESNTADDSANQNFGSTYSKAAINIGLVYLQWKPVSWLTLTGGKQRNPLYTTDLLWDPDINPEGGSEVATWTFPIDFGSSAPASNDPKAVASASVPSTASLTIGFTGFQGIYSDNNEFDATATNNTATGNLVNATDVWQFVEQIPIQFNFDKDTYIKEVPGFDTYTSGGDNGQSSSTGTPGGGGTQNFAGPNIADHLQILTAPGEIGWKLWDQPFKLYWDLGVNLDGKARVQDVLLGNNQAGIVNAAASPNVTNTQNQNRALGDNVAWLVGLQVGVNKKKGDWSLRGDFRQVGLGAIDPNENDSDWADSFLNQQGIKLQSTYNFTDFLTGSLTYYDTWDYKTNLMNGTQSQDPRGLPLVGGTGGYTVSGNTTAITNLVGASTVQRLDVHLQWKF